MGFYSRFVMPKLVNFACSCRPNMKQREKVVPKARGRVLEVGFGSGLNLPYYEASGVERIWALEPSPEMWALAASRVREACPPVEWLEASAEDVPLADASVDSVVVTYTLCTLPDASRSLEQLRRVLVPGGQLVFCEHGASPEENVLRWQKRMNPLWSRLAGGCQLDRPITELLERAGFQIDEVTTGYIPGWKPVCFNYWGSAVSP